MKKIFILLVIVFLAVFAACTEIEIKNEVPLKNLDIDSNLQDFIKINSLEQLEEYHFKNLKFSNLQIRSNTLQFAEDSLAKTSNGDFKNNDFQGTNNQELNVDEADIIKNDGSYIYVLSNNIFYVFEAKNELKPIFKEKLDGNYKDILINNNTIALLGNSYENYIDINYYDLLPYDNKKYFASILVYKFENNDIFNVENYSFSGDYYDARLINNSLYFIAKEYSYEPFIPIVLKGEKSIPNDFFIMPRFDSQVVYTIAGINLKTLEINSSSYGLDSSSTIYVSENNLYLATKSYYNNEENQKERQRFIINYLGLDIDLDDENFIEDIKSFYNSLSDKEFKKLKKDLTENLQKFEIDLQKKNDKTKIYKFSLNDGKIEKLSQGFVNGSLLNQFSLSENNNNLRIVTTTSIWVRDEGIKQSNNVYILDKNLKLISGLEKLAEDERVYSARFENDRLYLVTFREVDPFFVIDLSNPLELKILGELKIPGYSSYLHKINENIVIGIGKDTKESIFGGIIDDGLKVSLFDVSNESKPIELDNFIAKGQWSTSPVLNEHKAFFYDKNRSLLILPVSIQTGDDFNQRWQGIYFFKIKDTIEKIGEIKFQSEEYWNNEVLRSTRIENLLYSISNNEIKLIDIDLIKELDSFEFEKEEIIDTPYFK